MAKLSIKAALDRLGLKQSEFARLIEVSPRTVSFWATGESSLPGPVAAYLRVLAMLPPASLSDELRRVKGRAKMLDEGLYNVEYRSTCVEMPDGGNALAVLRNGKILGSDRWGGVFMGSYDFDHAMERNSVHLRMNIPPEGVLVTGFHAGEEGATIDIVGSFERAAPVTMATANVGGFPVEVTMTYLGPLPN
ncbi:MAG: helix-turn-helix domain-containing protein [Hyphomicrobiaceae bacterium]|nr:helix-turn-helix domain-containing protein [Hyphomicrobiaceae bacterium]